MDHSERSHAASVELSRTSKGEYSIRVVARGDFDDEAIDRAVAMLRLAEDALEIESPWHTTYDTFAHLRGADDDEDSR